MLKSFQVNMSNDRNIQIGNMIKTIRKSMQITQEMLADKIGVSTQQVHKYETGKDCISSTKLADIANVFGCDISIFFPKQPTGSKDILTVAQRKNDMQIKKKTKNDEAISLLKSFFSCNKDDRKKIIDFAKEMANKQ